jgi:hypothetical protein
MDFRYRYSVQLFTVTGRQTPAGWQVGKRFGHKGLGQPNAAKLAQYVADYNASVQPDGCNAHLGAGAVAIGAVVKDHDNDARIVAGWGTYPIVLAGVR